MFNIGSQELLIILLLVFLLFGPRHIPEVARTLGKGLGDVQRAMRGVEDNMRRAASEIPRAVDADRVSEAPKMLPAAEAIPKGAGLNKVVAGGRGDDPAGGPRPDLVSDPTLGPPDSGA